MFEYFKLQFGVNKKKEKKKCKDIEIMCCIIGKVVYIFFVYVYIFLMMKYIK